MKCKKCGAVLLDTDTFCVKCGQKVGQPMFCSNCGEQLREGERFCHKCGSPVETAEEDEEIPLSQQKTVDIPFDQIEQGILMEAEQAIVKRPETDKPERRNPESYRRPKAQMPGGRAETGYYAERPVRSAGYYEEPDEGGPYEAKAGPGRRTPPRARYEEEYGAYEEYEEEEEEEDSGDSKMKAVTIILGIVVIAVALAVGFILWQRNNPSRYDRPDEETEQGDESEEGDGDGEGAGDSDTQGRIQILSNVNVRNAPTTDGSNVLMVAKQGEVYEYYELIDDAWYRIKLEDGSEGYVSQKYVEDLQ